MAGRTLTRSIHSFRSWLITPATKADRFARAAEAGADALIIDLEDAVAPSAKEEARATALRYLAANSTFRRLRRLSRITRRFSRCLSTRRHRKTR
jgi:citrate lyase beta subunit